MKFTFPTVATVAKETIGVVARFPYVVLAAAAGTLAAIAGIEADDILLLNVLLTAAMGLPLMLGLRLVRERMEFRRLGMAVEVLGLVFLAAFFLSFPPDYKGYPNIYWMRFLVIDLGLHFGVAFVPCLTGAGEWEYWQFNRRLFLRFALALLYTTVLYVGLTLALVSLGKLLDLEVSGKRYSELWTVMVGMFNTLFFLGGIPASNEELEADTDYPRALRAFAQFALAPLVLVFVIILYLYAFKIMKAWSWPHGWVGKPIYFFSVVGILAALLLQPARQIETERWAKWYWKYFFRALGPLAILLLFSLRERMSNYGLTELRYYGFVVGIWLLGLSLLFVLRPGASTRVIPGSLALICLLSAAGPLSSFSVSLASQQRRLIQVLSPLGAIENGGLAPAKRLMSLSDETTVRSILDHMIATYDWSRLQPLFATYVASRKGESIERADWNQRLVSVNRIIAFLGGKKIEDDYAVSNGSRYLSVEIDSSHGIPIDGYRRLYHVTSTANKSPGRAGDLTFVYHVGELVPKISLSGKELDNTAVRGLLTSIVKAGGRGNKVRPAADMSVKLVAGPREWLFVVKKISGTIGNPQFPFSGTMEIEVLEK